MKVAPSLVAAALLLSPSLSAQPTLWQAARDPRTITAYRLLVRVERKLFRAESESERPSLALREKREALGLLRGADPALPEPRLRFLLGRLLAEPPEENYAESRRWLEAALGEAPEAPFAGRAWLELGIDCAKLGDLVCEANAYTRALGLVWDKNLRAQVYANRADGSMAKGDMEAALADYRRAIELGPDEVILTLAYYGLGVALERHGDWPAALAAMNQGTNLWPSYFQTTVLDLPSVFFVPAYDVHYYRALLAMARAQAARTDGSREGEEQQLEQAIGHWHRYLREAEPARHRWVRNARTHLASAERLLAALRRP